MHLQAASTLIPVIAKSLETTQPPASWAISTEEGQLSFESAAALKFVMNAFIWFDTLTCVSLGSRSLFYDQRHLLELPDGRMQQDQLLGCSN